MKQRSGFDSGGSANGADDGDRQDRAHRGVRFENGRGDRNGGYPPRRFPRSGRDRDRDRDSRQSGDARRRKVRIFFTESLTHLPLPKLLVRARYLSPALAQRFIESGRVRVNARVVMSPIYEVNLLKERVTIDEVATEYPRQVTYMVYNKPRNSVCERGDPTFDEIFDPERVWTFPFGRLSRGMSGLVIVSGDPRSITTQHLHDTELQKEYRIKINRVLDDSQIDELRRGVDSEDDYFVPVRVSVRWRNESSMWLDVTVLDDSPHHLYKALKSLGCEVLSIRRIRIALLHENMVPTGEWRELGAQEVAMLGLQRFLRGELPPEPAPPPRLKSFRERERDRERERFRRGSDRRGGDRSRRDRGDRRGGGGRGERDERRRGDAPRDDRRRDDRARGERPREEHQRDERRRDDRRRDDRPRGDRPDERRRDDRARDDRPRDERRGDRSRDERRGDRPREERRDERPREGRRHDDRSREERPREGRARDGQRREDRPRDERRGDNRPPDDRRHDDRGGRPRDDRRREGHPRDDRPRDDRRRDELPRDRDDRHRVGPRGDDDRRREGHPRDDRDNRSHDDRRREQPQDRRDGGSDPESAA